jgi:imidazolonepropionase-like amidohydrolase
MAAIMTRWAIAWLLGALPVAAQVVAFTGARIIDGTGAAPIDGGVLVAENERIRAVGPARSVSIPAGARRIDVSGRTIVPGLINAYGHVGETQGLRSGAELYTEENVLRQLSLYARYGVTSVFSLGGDREPGFRARDSQNTATLKRARVYLAGPVITGKTGEEARAAVERAVAMKPEWIKIRVDDNLGSSVKMPPEVYRAVIDQARKHKLPVAAHMFYLEDARGLLESGAALLAHSIRDKDVDAAVIALLKQKGVCVCPTLTREVSTFVYESRPEFFDDPFFLREADPQVLKQLQEPKRMEAMRNSASAQRYKAALQQASRNLKKLVDAGVKIAMGTDTGPPARFQGYFEHLELELMAKAGMTPMQILQAATADAAECMQAGDSIGRLRPGAWADLIVVEKNPLEDIRNLRGIQSVWIAGNEVK